MVVRTHQRSVRSAASAAHPAVTAPAQAHAREPGAPLKLGKQQRLFDSTEILIERKNDTTTMSFPCSSEQEVERYWGTEILSHDKSAVRLDRINRGAAPVLFNHDYNVPIGMVTGGRIEKNRLVVDTKWFTTDDAKRVEQMVVGGLRNVSLGYRIYAVTEEVKEQRFTAVDWEPFEVSIVTVPADPTVGIGREADEEVSEVRIVRAGSEQQQTPTEEVDPMLIRGHRLQNQAGAGGSAGGNGAGGGAAASGAGGGAAAGGEGGAAPAAGQRQPDITAGPSAQEMEQARIRAIDHFVSANSIPNDIRNMWVTSGASLERVGEEIVHIVKERNKGAKPVAQLDLTAREAKRFSMSRAIEAVCNGHNWSKAGFEAECSSEIMRKIGAQPDPNKFYVPLEVQQRQVGTPVEELAYALMKRDLSVAANGGGFLVETANISFVELLRNRSVAFAMGATRMPGMVGNFTIPKQSAAGTAFWLANETSTITESQQTFVQISCSPKTVGGYTEISRQLLLQSSPAAEGLVMADLAAIVALAADLAILNGSGAAGQPTGILNTAGIGSVTGTSLAYDDIVEFQTDTAAGNALFGSSGFVTTPAVAGLLKQRVKFANTETPLWEGQLLDGTVDGYRAMASNQIPAATMLFGYFASVLVPEWGVLGVEVNPFANFQAGIVGVRAMYSMDVGVRYPTSFSAAATIT